MPGQYHPGQYPPAWPRRANLSHALRATLSTIGVPESEGWTSQPLALPWCSQTKAVSEISRFSMNIFAALRCTVRVSWKRRKGSKVGM